MSTANADTTADTGNGATSNSGMQEIGVLDTVLSTNGSPDDYAWGDVTKDGTEDNVPAMVVDPVHRLGFLVGTYGNFGLDQQRWESDPNGQPSADLQKPGNEFLLAFDLDTRQLVGTLDLGGFTSLTSLVDSVVDPANERLIGVAPGVGANLGVCAVGAPATMYVIDYSDLSAMTETDVPLGCAGSVQSLSAQFVSLDSTDGKLYIAGTYQSEGWRWPIWGNFIANRDGQPLIVAQIDLNKLYKSDPTMVDWSLDLRYAGCQAFAKDIAGDPVPTPFVARAGNDVLAYCADNSKVGEAALGYVVRIPLKDSAPVSTCGGTLGGSSCQGLADPTVPQANSIVNYEYHRAPTLASQVSSAVDPQTGNVMLMTVDPVNGDAVWIFDPHAGAQRFVGVITGGDPDQPVNKTAVGFDSVAGRAYMLTRSGILMTQTRLDQLSTGVPTDAVSRDLDIVPKPTDGAVPTQGHSIAVLPADAGHPTLLFVPIKGVGYRVVEDDIPDAPSTPPYSCTDSAGNQWSDPDCNTDPSLTEDPNSTQSSATGSAAASGTRVLVDGGLRTAEDNVDPLCSIPPQGAQHRNFVETVESSLPQECLADALLAQGDSDFSLGISNVSTSSDLGSQGEASALALANTDHADADNLSNPAGEQKYTGQYVPFANPYDPATCADPGDRKQDASPSDPNSAPQSLTAASSAQCDGSHVFANAFSAISAIAVPSPSQPVVTVAQTWSTITTGDTATGQETKTEAGASGITIGGQVSIGEVVADATSVAHGHSGTTSITYSRKWCAITIAAVDKIPGCIDPDKDTDKVSVVDEINQALGNTWITAPGVEKQASPGGYQAVAAKDPGQFQADSAVNGDYSVLAPAMQITHYNDGPSGLSRIIVQLGNIDSEARYSVLPVPDFGSLDNSLLPEPSVSASLLPTPSLSPVATPQTQQSQVQQPVSQATTPTPQVRSTYVPPTTVVRTIRPAAAVAPLPLTNPGSSPDLAPDLAPPPSGILAAPQQAISRALHLLVENPAQFALLAGIWLLLLAPAFVAYRRRSWARALEA